MPSFILSPAQAMQGACNEIDSLTAENTSLREALAQAVGRDENVPALWVENEALRQMLARVRDVLLAEIAMPHECSDCGWQVGGVPRGLHNFGCRVANAVDEARDLLDPPRAALSPGPEKG